MPNWSSWRKHLDFAAVLPDQWRHLSTVLEESLLFFLHRLAPHRQIAILADQWALGPDVSFSERMFHLAHQSPTLHKLGQVIARDRRLPLEFRRQLQQLETMPVHYSCAEIRSMLVSENIPVDDPQLEIGEYALAEASVAVVIPFRFRDGAGDTGTSRDGVFKVLKPGIEVTLSAELEVLRHVGDFLDQNCHEHSLPTIDYADTFAEIANLLEMEIRLDLEQQHLMRAAEQFRGCDKVHIPSVFDVSTPRVTAMERLFGTKITETRARAGEPLGDTQSCLGQCVTETLIGKVLWNNLDAALFHADPHAGNLMWTQDNRLGVLDWSLVGELTSHQRQQMTQLLLAAVLLDVPAVVRPILALSQGSANTLAVRRIVEDNLRALCQGTPLGMTWLMNLLDVIAASGAARFPSQLTLFRKALFTIQGVLADISPQESLDKLLLNAAYRQWMTEWPERLVARFGSRQFGSTLSNADITGAILQAHCVPWRASMLLLSSHV
jgi:ubiquinone biosynthesis protein